MQIVVGKKYEVAVNKETPVMTLEWIEVVWKKGQTENIHATDPQFAKWVMLKVFGHTRITKKAQCIMHALEF